MAGLEDFQSTFTPGLDDFVSSSDQVAPVVNNSSNLNLAAHVAAMSPDPQRAVDTYRQVGAELSQTGKSQASDQLLEQSRQQAFQEGQKGLVDVLSDPTVPDADKRTAANNLYDVNSAMYNTRNLLSAQALRAPSGDENTEQEVVRTNLASQMGAINDVKRQQQELLNSEVAKTDASSVKAFTDIFGMFLPFMDQKMAGSVQGELVNNKPGAYAAALTLLGTSKMSVKDMLTGLPTDQKIDMTKRIINAVNNNSTIVMPDGNDYAKVEYLRNVLEDGHYDDTSKWVDNAVGVLDLVGLGGVARRAGGLLKGGRATVELSESAIRDTVRQSVTSQVQPTTVSQNLKDTNPAKAAAAHESAAADVSGEAAESLYGTNRVDAVASDIAPTMSNVDGGVKNKVGDPESMYKDTITPNPEVMDFVYNRGDVYYDASEKIKQRAAVVNDFKAATGLTPRSEMFNVESKADGVSIKAVYGPAQGGFSSPQHAMEMAQWAMRDYGVPEEAISLLRRDGANYVPVAKEEADSLLNREVLSDRRVELQGQEPSLITSTRGVSPDNGVLPMHKWPDEISTIGEKLDKTAKLPGREYKLKDGSMVTAKILDEGDGEQFTIQLSKNGKNVGSIGANKGAGLNPDIEVEAAYRRKGAATLLYDLATESGLSIGAKNSKQAVRTKDGIAVRKAYEPGQSKSFRSPAPESVTQTDIGSRVTVRKKPTDYLIQVDHNYQFSPADMQAWSEFDVKNNIFDRIGASYNGPGPSSVGFGSIQRHLVDPASMFRRELAQGATNAIDRSAALEKSLIEIGDDFATGMRKMAPDRQRLMDAIIREANEQGLDLDYSKLSANGVKPSEIQALKSWREFWDTTHHLENADAGRTLRNAGYAEFVDPAHDTKLFARPVARTQAGAGVKIYDHTTGNIRNVGADELTELYSKDGEIAHLRSPVQVGNDSAEFIINPNKAGGAYLRRITDDTSVLAYRKGYYSVNYTDPHFIIKKVKGADGKVLYERAVATAKTKKQADLLTGRMTATDTNHEYYNRLDLKGTQKGSDAEWDLYSARGRSAQRTRGQRLEDTTSGLDPSQANIMSPVDSLIHSARSISRRVEMRDYLDAGKLRSMNQYSDYYPKGNFPGSKVYPGKITDIQYRGDGPKDARKLADARSTFEYIKYLEDGYINHIDDTVKNSLKFFAEAAGNRGFEGAEKALHWMSQGRGPIGWSKSAAFNLYLATNPLRQFVVQGHQAIQLFALNPNWFLTGRAVPQTYVMAAKQMGFEVGDSMLKGSGWTKQMADQVFKDFEATGQVAAIDKQNLVRGSLLNLADQTAASRGRRILSAPLSWSRKVGFDSGEYVNTVSSYLSHRDQAFRAGADLTDKEVLGKIAGDSRNYTYNMNSAGDLPYNQNALSAVFQFMQVPHKAFLTMTLNRQLSGVQKLRMVGFNALMYTLPPAAMYNLFGDILPDDPNERDAVVQGLEGITLNKMLSLASNEKSDIDFSGLAPLDMFGTYEFIHSLFTTDVGTIVSSTPGGQMLFGNNPRITNFAKVAARHFNLIDDYESPTKFSEVATEFAKLSSGFSNAFKASYAMKYHQKINAAGAVTDPNVSTPTAIAQLFGFSSMTEARSYYVKDATYNASKSVKDDATAWYKDYKQHLTRQGITPTESAGVIKTYGEAWRHFGNDNYEAKRVIDGLLRQDVLNGDDRMYQSVLRMAGQGDQSKFKSLVNALPNVTEEKRKQLQDTADFINGYKDPTPEK